MVSYTRPRSRKDFHIAIICALKKEADAVLALFDEDWEKDELYKKADGDFNSYSIGRIGPHNVVLAHMPGMGKGASASLAASFRSSFVNIKLALVVGICGGVPTDPKTKKEVLLGDVVISTGVIQIDFGRQFSDALRRKTGHEESLPPPNVEIRGFLNKIAGTDAHKQLVQRTNDYIDDLLRNGKLEEVSLPSADEDDLFPSSYRHKHQISGICETCDACQSRSDPVCVTALEASCSTLQCDRAILLRRSRSESKQQHTTRSDHNSKRPHACNVHFGLMASSDQVIRSAWHRDQFSEEENAIAFEMEGAGVWNNLPTILIKGVCDYADSHKNKTWQGYGAICGAACLKALLQEWRPMETDTPWTTDLVGEQSRKLSTVPRNPSRLYTGREDIGIKLANAFKFGNDSDASSRKCFVISGLGGTGKSEVCFKFAADHRNKYWAIFWIDCASDSSAKECFVRIGKLCNVNEPDVDSVKDFLSSTEKRWLLILDNADDLQIDFSKYFPAGNRGHVIITTRNPHFANSYHTVGFEALDQLESQDASELLLQSAGIAPTDWPGKQSEATKIVEKLGRHTLAIIQAGAYIKDYCRLDEYYDQCDKHLDTLLNFKRDQEHSDYKTVHITFEISRTRLKDLSKNRTPGAQDALHLLDILGFFHYEGAIEKIFTAAALYAPRLSREGSSQTKGDILELSNFHIDQLPSYSPHGKAMDERLRWQQACVLLTKFSIISITERDGSAVIFMHPLVHSWLKLRQDLTSQSLAWLCASSIMALSCSGCTDYISFFDHLQIHVASCFANDIERYAQIIKGKELVAVLWQLAWVKYRMHDDNYAETILKLIVEELKRHESISTKRPTRSKTSKIRLFRKLQFGHSKGKSQVIKAFDESFVNVARLKGYWLEQRGDIPGAIYELEYVVEKCDEDDPDYLSSQSGLASLYLADGQILDAIRLLEHVVGIQEKKLDEGHPERLASQHQLACAYLDNGQILDAINLLVHVVKIQEKKLDEGHPDRLASQHALACAYLANGQILDAINLLVHVVKIREKKLDEGHPDRLSSQHELARAYLKNRQILDAINLLVHVVKIREKKLDEGHPNRLASQHELAWAYHNNGQSTKALGLLHRSLSFRGRARNPEHRYWAALQELADDIQAAYVGETSLSE